MSNSEQRPESVQNAIDLATAQITDAFDASDAPANIDPHHERIVEKLIEVAKNLEEENKLVDRYFFDEKEFQDALQHVVADQLSALRKDKIDVTEWSARFNRWFVFCDAVVNLGISCAYTQDALKSEGFETVLKTLKINKTFIDTFLKPHDIRVEMNHKSKLVKEKYSWLAMPVLVVKDAQGNEHQIAITPSPRARVWWLDVLISFHGSYEWVLEEDVDVDEGDDVPPTTLDDPRVKR